MTSFFYSDKNTTNQKINAFAGFEIVVKREDEIHPVVSGNKFRKLKYNLLAIQAQKQFPILSFGGAFSNHLAALAVAANQLTIPAIGIVRGEEWAKKIVKSATLSFCANQGMQLKAVSRERYRLKEKGDEVLALQQKFPHLVCLPEGGTNALAVQGCEEIVTPKDHSFDVICASVGTGGTLAGLIESSSSYQHILGFMALQDASVTATISRFTSKTNWELVHDYTFGGYAKISPPFIAFLNRFYQQYGIPLDPIYTGKMVFGIFDLIQKQKWKWGQKILIIHSGGLQGIAGINAKLQKKGEPLLNYSSHY